MINLLSRLNIQCFSENVVNFINDYKSAVDNIVGLTGSIADSKIVSFNTLNSIYGLKDFNPNKMLTSCYDSRIV